MSNGPQCCAIEVCCDPPAVRAKLPILLAKHAGVNVTPEHVAHANLLLDFMDAEGIAFAPVEVKPLIQAVLVSERQRVAHAAQV